MSDSDNTYIVTSADDTAIVGLIEDDEIRKVSRGCVSCADRDIMTLCLI